MKKLIFISIFVFTASVSFAQDLKQPTSTVNTTTVQPKQFEDPLFQPKKVEKTAVNPKKFEDPLFQPKK